MKKTWNIVLWVVVGVFVFIAALTVYYKGLRDLKAQLVPPGNTVTQGSSQQPLPTKDIYEFSLTDINGKTVKLSDFRGKIVFLNFWATWCPYCVKEMPDLDRANKELLKGNDAVVITVDVGEKVETVKEYLSKNNISLPVLMDFKGSVGDQYGVTGIPATFVFNRDGTLYKRIGGPTSESAVLDIVEQIK